MTEPDAPEPQPPNVEVAEVQHDDPVDWYALGDILDVILRVLTPWSDAAS